MKLAGLDVGTTGCKITVFDGDGHRLGSEYAEYPARRTHSAHEVDADALTDGIFEVLRRAAKAWPDLDAIGITSFGEAFIAADEAGHPLFPLILYTDPRGAEECTELVSKLGAERLTYATGLAPHSMYSLPKLMYLMRHEAETFARVKHVYMVGDYVGWLLTGEAKLDYSLATRFMAMDIRTLAWDREILAAAGVDPALLSTLVPSGTLLGCLTQEAAEKTGLSPRTRIVFAAHDQVAAAAGAGVFGSGVAVDGAGTVECITPVFSSIPEDARYWQDKYNAVPYFGRYVAYAFSYTGGALLQWCADTLCKGERAAAEAAGQSLQSYLQAGDYEPTGLLVLPHFAGAATPYMDTGSRGAVLGLDLSTTARDVYLACLEGVAYEMRLNTEHLARAGVTFDRLVATGGGAKSSLWMQIKADVLNKPIDVLESSEAGTVGCAMLAGVAIGAFTDLADACRHMVRIVSSYTPDAARHARYSEIYRRYEQVYGAVRPLM